MAELFFLAIFGTVAGVFELVADAVAAGHTGGDSVERIIALHIARAVEEFNAAARGHSLTARHILSAIAKFTALALAKFDVIIADRFIITSLKQLAGIFRTMTDVDINAGFW